MASKHEIKTLLKENLLAGKPIHAIISVLQAQLQRDLNMMEDYYVKYKCLKYCLDSWVEQCTKQLQALEPEYLSDSLEDINALTVKALAPKQFPRELRLLTQNKPFKFLEDFCHNYISEDARHERLIILETFKTKIWNNVLETVEEYKGAREYLEHFQLLLTESGISKQDLITGLKLQTLSTPLDDDDLTIIKTCLEKMKQKYMEPSPQKIITKLISIHENRLGSSADSEKLIVKNKLGLRLQYFMKQPNISLDRGILTVCGSVLSISEVYPEILKQLQTRNVYEIHLYSPDVILVDHDLLNEEFKGVNFVVCCTKLIIICSHVWDFSGEHGQSAFSINPPKAVNPLQNGLDGEDGKPGKSGGNLHILISSVIGQGVDPSFHIRSNGGDGGSGQPGGEGGDGVNGEDGDKYTSLDEEKFRSMIPKVSRFNDKVSNRHQLKCYQALIDIMDAENGYLKENQSEYLANGERFVYQTILTAAGAEAGFSIYEGPIHTNAYGFHVYYFGSPGSEGSRLYTLDPSIEENTKDLKNFIFRIIRFCIRNRQTEWWALHPYEVIHTLFSFSPDGGHGGRGGRGGYPGYAGEIDIQLSSNGSNKGSTKSPRNSGQLALITVEKSDGNPGKDGPSGKKGQPGKPGRKGNDFACVHPFKTIHGRTFYKGALIKRLHESNLQPSPYCGFAKSKIHFENSVRESTRLKNEHKRFELKARSPVKTTQKQRSIIKANTENQFEAHCRKYFLNIEFRQEASAAHFYGRLSQQVFESSSIHSALQTLQIASRICDFNPRDPVPPPRKRKLREHALRVKTSLTFLGDKRRNPSSAEYRKSLLPSATQSPLLNLVQSLLVQEEDGKNSNSQHIKDICRRIQEAVHGSQDKTALSVETCERLLFHIMRITSLDANVVTSTNTNDSQLLHNIQISLTHTLRYQLLNTLHREIELLPEVKIGKVRKLDPNFFLAFIKNGGQLENNFQSSNFHIQVGQDIERCLKIEAEQLVESCPSHLFTVLKTSILEKGVTKFTTFMDYLNRYTKKHVKKLSKNVEGENDNEDAWTVSLQRSIPRGLNRLGVLEYCFFQEYFEREGVGAEHHQKLKTIIFAKLNKWLSKQDVLIEYAKMMSIGPLSDWDFDILATIYGVQLCVYKKNELNSSDTLPQMHLRYSTHPLTNSVGLLNNEPHQLHPTSIKIIETDVNFSPLASCSTISNQQAQIYLEILNDTSRPEFFDEFDLADKTQAIQGCFMNRRFTLSKLFTPPASADLEDLTQNLCSILATTPKIVQLAMMTSASFNNRLIQEFVNRLTWQGDLLSIPPTLVELGLAILGSDEVDMLNLEWIIASLPQEEWMLEIIFIILRQILCAQQVHQFQWRKWKQDLSSLDPAGLILIVEKAANYCHERRSAHPDETYSNMQLIHIIDHISSIISEITLTTDDIYNNLLDIRLQDWPKMLTNIKIRKTFQLLNTAWKDDENNQEYKKCIYYASSLHNEHPSFIDEYLRVLRRINQKHSRIEIDAGRLLEIFSNYYHGYWSISNSECEINFQQLDSFEFLYTVLAHQNDSKIPKGERTRDEILKYIANDKNTTLSQMNIQRIRIELKEEPKSGFGFLDKDVPLKMAISKWALKVKTLALKEKPSVGEMLFTINSGIFQCKGFYLRDTQKVTLVTMLQEENRNVLAQVSTGEGKSVIVVAWAIIKVLLGGRCDVITSSPILAERDAQENKDIFDLFHITVGHNSSCDIEARKSEYKNDVVYGDVANFQRDYLLNKYHDTNILGERSALENLSIMVDEVDSMLLDKGNSVLYLSHKPAGVEALNPIFIFIWKTMNLNSNPEEPVTFALVKKAVLSEMYTVITPENFKCLEVDNDDGAISMQIHAALHDVGLLDLRDCYISKQISKQPVLPHHLSSYELPAWYIIKSEVARKREFVVPKHLEEFVDLHLDTWISSAFRALELISGKEYIVDTTSKSFITPDKDPKIIIVDRDTGVDLFQSQWNDALHQFLELKHQCAFSHLSLKAIFISNISYFRQYGLIHGLTGTLGSEIERNFLKKTYSVEFVNIPTATPKKFVEELPIVAGSLEEWRDSIVSKAIDLITSEDKKRSALIICESINDADYLYLGLLNRAKKRNSGVSLENIHLYKRSYEKFSILTESDDHADKELCPGELIISTNLAGRGTDIKITDELNINGGLCVILTYLPNNIRVEQQAFGRASRKGQNGSGILIIRNRGHSHSMPQCNNNNSSSSSNSDEVTIIDLKNDRDECEVITMTQIESEFESIIGYEESLFYNFSNHYQRIKPKIKEFYNRTAIQNIVLQSLIDKWAFWLDKTVTQRLPYQDAVKSLNAIMRNFQEPNDENKEDMSRSDLLNIMEPPSNPEIYNQKVQDPDAQTEGSLSLSNLIDILDSPTHLVSIGKLYLDKSMWSQILGTVWNDNTYASHAIPFFDKAISILGNSSLHTTIPLYYKAYTMIIQKDVIDKETRAEAKTLLRLVEHGFRSLIAEECSHVSVVSSIALRLHETSHSFIQVETFKDQRKNMISLYQLFVDSIHDIMGSVLLPTHFQTLSITTQDHISELLTQLRETQLIRNCSVIELPPCNNDAVPGGVTNRLVYKCINPDIQMLQEISTAYGIRSTELHEMVLSLREECETKMNITNEEIRLFFEHRLRLPTRAQFWEALVSSSVISGLKTVGVICDSAASKLIADPVYKRLQKDRKVGDIFGMDVQGHLFYTNLPRTNVHIPTRYPAIIIRDSYSDAIRNADFIDLQARGLIELNQYGEWMGENMDKLTKELEYGAGYLLKFEYALVVLAERGVPVDYLDYNIFYHLFQQNLMTQQGLLLHTDFDRVNWGKYAFFKHEIISVLQLQCIYRVYTLYLHKEITIERSYAAVNLSFINSDPCSSLVNDLFYNNILRRCRMVSGSLSGPQFHTQFKTELEKLATLTMEDVKNFFKRANIPALSILAFWFHLISKGWLKVVEVGHADEIPTIGKLNIPKNFTAEHLEDPWNTTEIINFLTIRGALIHEKQAILQSLEQFTSRLNLIKEPDGSLTTIESRLNKVAKHRMHSEISVIQSMGLDAVISVFDKAWKVSKIGKTASSCSSGYLQIAAGIAISVYSVGFGTFSGQTLIDQGICDIWFSLMSIFNDNLTTEGYWAFQTSFTSSLIALISPAVSAYLIGVGCRLRYGSNIVSRSAANGQSMWLRLASNAGHQLGQEVIKVIQSEISYSGEVASIEQKIKSKFHELMQNITAQLSKRVEEFMGSEPVIQLCQRIGNDEARSELVLTLTQDNYFQDEWEQMESLIQTYADIKLIMIRNWVFEKKNITSKYQLYVKQIEKFLKWDQDKDGGSGSDLVGELANSISLILKSCITSINNSIIPNPTKPQITKTSTDSKYQNKFIAFEINTILCNRVEEILYDLLLAPVCNTITNNFLTDADASLIRQLSQSRRNLVKSFTLEQHLSRLFMPKQGITKDSTHTNETVDYDIVQELRLKRLCQNLISMEQKCTDPYLLSEFVLAELSCGQILLQACANWYNCKIILKELDGSRFLRKIEVTPANPRQGEEQGTLLLEIPPQNNVTESTTTAAQMLDTREKSQRLVLDSLLDKLIKSKIVQNDITRDELRHQLADVIRSDVAILITLRNRRMNMK